MDVPVTSSFASVEQMSQFVEVGVVEGIIGAMGQIDERCLRRCTAVVGVGTRPCRAASQGTVGTSARRVRKVDGAGRSARAG